MLSDFYSSGQDFQTDTLDRYTELFNGKIWTNRYRQFDGDPWLFVNYFLKGKITILGKTFENIPLRYDIYSDEVLTPVSMDEILQLNREMVDSFSFDYSGENYSFVNKRKPAADGTSGYFMVKNGGDPAILVKYKKDILPSVVPGRDYEFVQTNRVFLVKQNEFIPVRNIKTLISFLEFDASIIRDHLKAGRIKMSGSDPSEFVTVVRFYSNMKK